VDQGFAEVEISAVGLVVQLAQRRARARPPVLGSAGCLRSSLTTSRNPPAAIRAIAPRLNARRLVVVGAEQRADDGVVVRLMAPLDELAVERGRR
jgi:hypothetical protein